MPEPDAARGALVLVVGPSGAGKDTLIAHAARAFAGAEMAVARRIVTRQPSGAEDHDAVDAAAFAAAASGGQFAVSWQAHGLDYAIPRGVEEWLAQGKLVLCNVSRGVVDALRVRYPQVRTIYVDAPVAIRQARIAARRRSGETAARAQRTGDFAPEKADVVVDNGGTLAEGCARFEAAVAAILAAVRSRPATPGR